MVTITYNGKSTELADGEGACLECYGKIMKSDVTVSGDSFASVQYSNSTADNVDVEEGQCATIHCEGKLMRNSIRVGVRCDKLIIYDIDDTTILWETTILSSVPVTLGVSMPNSTTVSISYYDNGTWVFTMPFTSGGVVLSGISESNYYQTRYTDGDSIDLPLCHKTLRYSLRPARLAIAEENRVTFFGLGYVDGVICAGNYTGTMTWAEWVDYTLSGSKLNTIGAQIISGRVYTSDGIKILHDSNGNPVHETDVITRNGEYTFINSTVEV